MNKVVKYILTTFAVIAVAAYLLIALAFVDNKKQSLHCKDIKINIDNEEQFSFISQSDIKSALLASGEKIIDERLDKINTFKLKQILSKNNAIKSITIFTTVDANLNVEIKQRRPILRVQCNNARFYIDDSGYMFPFLPKPNLHVPIVTGTIAFVPTSGFVGYIKKNESGKFLTQLYEFAVFLQNDAFWNSMIEQIIITNNKVEIVPQIAGHIVKFGSLDNFQSKLNKLQKFYKNAMPTVGWETYKTINIEYKNQIICKK